MALGSRREFVAARGGSCSSGASKVVVSEVVSLVRPVLVDIDCRSDRGRLAARREGPPKASRSNSETL